MAKKNKPDPVKVQEVAVVEAPVEAPRRPPSEWMKRKKIRDFIHAGVEKMAKWRGEPITEADYDKAVTGFLKNPPIGKK